MIKILRKYQYLLSRLVQRDFIQKYKKTTLGVIWSVISPLCEFAILMLVFKNLFGRNTPHYTIYMMVGLLTYNYYSNATNNGMHSFLSNAGIMQKINLPSWLFPLSRTISAAINFLITCIVMIVFLYVDRISLTWKMLSLIYPFVLLFFFNLGVSLILATLYVFFKDVQYLYHIFNRLLYFCCAIFWTTDHMSETAKRIMMINPVYDFIVYGRMVIMDGVIPSIELHLLLFGYTSVILLIGIMIYRCNCDKFIFYL